jgi:hypothetical protein
VYSYSRTIIYNYLHLIRSFKQQSTDPDSGLLNWDGNNILTITSGTNQGYTVIHQRVSCPRTRFMTRGSNHRHRLQSATFRSCVACSGSTCNSPSVQSRMHSPPAVSAERDHQCQRESAIATVHTLLMSPQYLGTGITSS